MSDTSEAAAKKPRARKTTTTGKTAAKKSPAKPPKTQTATAAEQASAAPAGSLAARTDASARGSAAVTAKPASRAPRKRTAAKTPSSKTPRPDPMDTAPAPAIDQAPPLPEPPADSSTDSAAVPAQSRAAKPATGSSRAKKEAKPAAKTGGASRRGGKKQAVAETGAAAETGSAEQAPEQAPAASAPAPAAIDTPLQEAAPESETSAERAEKTGRSPRGRGRASGAAGRAKKTPASKTEAAAAAPETQPEPAPAESRTGEAPRPETSSAAEPAADGEQPKEKSRRSRSRRGRRKSAAAKAAAQARQEGEPAESEEGAVEGSPDTQEVDFEGVEDSDLAGPTEISFAGEEDEDDESDAGRETPPERAQGRKGRASAKDAKGGKSAKEPERARQKRKMFVSVLPGEQVEVVLTAEGQVQEYYVEMLHQVKIKGNIYKGVIHNVDANLQAAFVSYGAAKNGFLQIDEVHPEYYLTPHEVSKGHKYPLIQKVLKPGQEILVQVVKEPSGSKGAFLTSYLSLAGRFLVLTPGREQIGVSRKVDSEEERSRLRELLSGLNPGEGLGVIVRTVSSGATKTSLQKDLQLLKRVWKDVRKKGSSEPAPCLIYQELGLDTRAIRDYLTDEVTEIWVDDEEMAEQIQELVNVLFPRKAGIVQAHKDLDSSLFERFGLKKQLEQVHSREVTLPSGGRLVFDHTEALMAIDINSGRSAGKNNFEDTAFKTNLEAAQQIPLQLRLRDIGGQVVIDFIEMRDRSHWREVEKAVRNGMKNDRARHDIGKISSFGLMEIVRQRLSSSAISTTVEPCPCCKGTGQRRNLEWQAMQVLRDIRAKLRKQSASGGKGGNGANGNGTLVYSGNAELILYLLNNKRERLAEMEQSAGLHLELKPE